MKVIVTGSRSWHDREPITNRLALLPGTDETVIVVGYNPVKDSPPGVDRIAYQEAQKLGLLLEPYPADWDRHGKRAGVIRNEEMATSGADLCIAFWDGRSVGTLDMMTRAVHHQIPVEVVMKGERT
jgi:YspA, cpYpsA-related SLOG family